MPAWQDREGVRETGSDLGLEYAESNFIPGFPPLSTLKCLPCTSILNCTGTAHHCLKSKLDRLQTQLQSCSNERHNDRLRRSCYQSNLIWRGWLCWWGCAWSNFSDESRVSSAGMCEDLFNHAKACAFLVWETGTGNKYYAILLNGVDRHQFEARHLLLLTNWVGNGDLGAIWDVGAGVTN
jgi:hypothetical protein